MTTSSFPVRQIKFDERVWPLMPICDTISPPLVFWVFDELIIAVQLKLTWRDRRHENWNQYYE